MNSSHQPLEHFIRLLEPGADIEGEKKALLAQPGRADSFCEWLRQQKLCSCILRILPEVELVFSDSQREYFSRKKASQLKRNRDQLKRLFPILDQFDAAGLNVMLLKGAHLASRYYGGIENRFYGDVDLLVKDSDLSSAEKILRSAGLKLRNPLPFGRFLTFRHIHSLDYRTADLSIDLHWRVTDFDPHRIASRDLADRSIVITLENREVRVPGDADSLMIVLLHIFRDAARGIFRLQPVCDVWRILDICCDDLDWQQFFLLREQEGSAMTCAASLGIALAPCNDFTGLESLSPYIEKYLGRDWRVCRNKFVKFLESGDGVRAWARSIAGVSPARYAAWWLSSLPFRVATHLPNEINKLRRRIQ